MYNLKDGEIMIEIISGAAGNILTNIISDQIEDTLCKYKEKKIIENLIYRIRFTVEDLEKKYPLSIICKDDFWSYIKNYNIFSNFVEFYIKSNDVAVSNTPSLYIQNTICKFIYYMNDRGNIVTAPDKNLLQYLLSKIVSEIAITLNGVLSLNELYMLNHVDQQFSELLGEMFKFKSDILKIKDEIKSDVTNKFNEIKDILNEKISNNLEISNQTSNNLILSPALKGIINIISKPNTNIRLDINTDSERFDDLFKIIVCVKRKGLISRFDDTRNYINYLAFTGEQDELEVIDYKISISDNIIAQGHLEKTYTGAVCYLPTHTSNNIDASNLIGKMPTTFSEMVLKIIPPIQALLFDIEDGDNEKIIENIELGITRHLDNDELEVKLIDMRKNTDVRVNLAILFKGLNIISTTFSLSANEKHDVYCTLSYFQLLRKLSSCKKIILREKLSVKQFMEAQINVDERCFNNLNEQIDFYKKILRIQDFFKVKFNLPDKFDSESIRSIDELDILIKTGITYTCPLILTVNKRDMYNKKDFSVGAEFLFTYTFKGIEIFGQVLDLGELTMLLPKTVLKKVTKKQYVFNAGEPCLYIWDKKYGEFDPIKLATDEVLKYKQEKMLTPNR